MHFRSPTFSLAALACALLTACGGGGGGGGADQPAPRPVASVTLTLTSPEISREFTAGTDIDIVITGTWTGADLGATPVYLNVRDPAAKFTTETILITGSATFATTIRPVASLPVGNHSGLVEVRACKDQQCVNVFAGSKGMPYSITKLRTPG